MPTENQGNDPDNQEQLSDATTQEPDEELAAQGQSNEDVDDGEGAAAGDGSEPEGSEDEVDLGQPTRGQNRFQRLANEARTAREEAADLRRRLDTFEAQQRQRQAPAENPADEAARLALMSPEERINYRLDQAERRNQQATAQMQFQLQENADRSGFAALCASDPLAARLASKVEAKLSEIRAQGQNVSREALLDFLIGQEVRQKQTKAGAQQRRTAQQQVTRQQVRPGASRGDAAAPRRGGQSLEDRLANVTF